MTAIASPRPWMLYGAYGYTGVLIAEHAVSRGHRPILAGRDAAKLEPLAARLGLPFRVLDLSDPDALDAALSDVDLVFHAAGPFASTSAPMVDACLRTGTHYVDITGEIRVFEQNLARDAEARAAGIAVMSGVGFDVVPTDCAARYVASRVPDATSLEIAFSIVGPVSGGTAATAVDAATEGILVRRSGRIVRQRAGAGARRISLSGKARTIVPMTWGDVATAFHTTGIADITLYMATARWTPLAMRVVVPLARVALRVPPLRRLVRALVKRKQGRPSTDAAHTRVWAHARNARGESATVELSSIGSYPFTAVSGVLSVERILAGGVVGATTPALAFGPDFVLEVPGTTRVDVSSSRVGDLAA